jgi:hypothetical protein
LKVEASTTLTLPAGTKASDISPGTRAALKNAIADQLNIEPARVEITGIKDATATTNRRLQAADAAPAAKIVVDFIAKGFPTSGNAAKNAADAIAAFTAADLKQAVEDQVAILQALDPSGSYQALQISAMTTPAAKVTAEPAPTPAPVPTPAPTTSGTSRLASAASATLLSGAAVMAALLF